MADARLTGEQIVEMAEIFGLLSDPTRLSIVMQCREGEIGPGALAEQIGLSPSLVSHHLRLLRSARIVRAERRGKQVFYALADACVRDLIATMSGHLFAHGGEHGSEDGGDDGTDTSDLEKTEGTNEPN